MKRTIGICLFVIVLAAGLVGGWKLWNSMPENNPSRQEILIATEDDTEQPPVTAELMIIQEPYLYVLQEKDGVLVVYEHDGETIRMETHIQTHGLDDATKLLLRQGIHVKNDEELYDLLESYSS